jgi:hypothetical protein
LAGFSKGVSKSLPDLNIWQAPELSAAFQIYFISELVSAHQFFLYFAVKRQSTPKSN